MTAALNNKQIVWLNKRNIQYKVKELTIPLFKAIVSSYLEYYIHAWVYCRKKDITKLERIQNVYMVVTLFLDLGEGKQHS